MMSQPWMASSRPHGVITLALLVCWGALSCTPRHEAPGETFMKPVHRFAGPEFHSRRGIALPDGDADASVTPRPPSSPVTVDYPTATILDDTRFVLSAPPRGLVLMRKHVPIPAGATVSFRPYLMDPLKSARRVVVMPQLKLADEWRDLPPVLVETHQIRGETEAQIDLPVPTEARGKTSAVSITGYGVDPVALASLTTREVKIPERAALEFSIGILEPAWSEGPVDFSLLSCGSNSCDPLFAERIDPLDPEQRGGWRDRRLSLAQLEGATRSFLFEARQVGEGGRFSLPVWANPTIYAPAPRSPEDVNVILLSIDTLRADHLTSYGYRHDTAPFIHQRFAQGGTVFENCVAASTTTTPSHMTMFTSLQPAVHRLTTGMEVLPRSIATMPELIWAQGFETGAITENAWVGAHHGFGRGFDTYAENKSPRVMAPEGQIEETFARARKWLGWNREKRFFLFLHTYQVHDPYAAPAEYKGLYAEHAGITIGEDSPAHLQELVDYDREIRFTDDQLRSLFDALEGFRLGGSTVFILTSDHGEAFLEHGLLRHGADMYQESVSVPLMLWGPGIPAGERIAFPVGHVDLMPTILDLLGVPCPGPIEGSSLVGLINGSGSEEVRAGRFLFSESWAPLAWGEHMKWLPFRPPAYSVRVGSRKLARYRTEDGYRFEFYDLELDPLEQNDLYPSEPEAAADLVALIDEYERRSSEMRSGIDAAAGAVGDSAPRKLVLDPEQEQKLKALGYIQ
jgi:arylsulfatase A-like enzyme